MREQLESAHVSFLRVLWCDLGNQIRAKAVHTGSVAPGLDAVVTLARGAQGAPATADTVLPATGLTPVGEMQLVPDRATLCLLPFAPGHARVMGDMRVEGRPFELCPREFVRRMEARAREAGLEVSAAFENEFYLLRENPDGSVSPADDFPFASLYALNRHRALIDELAATLLAQRMGVEQLHAEAGPGQLEVSIRHAAPLEAADHQVALRETVHAVAANHGLRASFLPKPLPDQAGSGCHLHMGLSGFDDPQGKWGLSEPGRRFMAGVLDHLGALLAITAPIPNSYQRLVPHTWSGAYRCWGIENREAALRLPAHPVGPATNFEIKAMDAASNPYLAMGAVLAAGLDGVARELELPEPVSCDPASLPDETRPERLPISPFQALDRLEADEVLSAAFGPELFKALLALRRVEVFTLEDMGPEKEVRLLMGRY